MTNYESVYTALETHHVFPGLGWISLWVTKSKIQPWCIQAHGKSTMLLRWSEN